MATRAGLVGIFLLLGSHGLLGGCVVYRDRIVTVGQETRVSFEPGRTAMQQAPVPAAAAAGTLPEVPVYLDAPTIHGSLDAFGTWEDTSAYGSVWIPQVDPGFVPYGTNGEWVFSSAGWYWQSGYAWGAVAFHYGRWVQLEDRWGWVPGSVFAPAWVDWRYGNGWVGWSPLGPLGADYAAPYAYCMGGALTGAHVWDRVVYGPAAASLYPRTQAIAPAYGYGGSVYSWGPAPTVLGLPGTHGGVAVERVWATTPGAMAVGTPRTGVPVTGPGSMGAMGRPVGGTASVPGIPSVATLLNPATGTSRPYPAVPAYANYHPAVPQPVGDPGGVRTSFVGTNAPVPAVPGRLQGTVSLGSTWATTATTAPTNRVATWDRWSPTPMGTTYRPAEGSGFARPAAWSGGVSGAGTVYNGFHGGTPGYPSGQPVGYRSGSYVPSGAATSYAAHPAAPSFAPSSWSAARPATTFAPSYSAPSFGGRAGGGYGARPTVFRGR